MSYKVSKLAYRIRVILIANERVKKKKSNAFNRTMALGLALTEMSTRRFFWG
jgi:hypothetical protein